MRSPFRIAVVAAACALLTSPVLRAQQRGPEAAAKPQSATTPLKVQIVISRYKGESRISSLSYQLTVHATDRGGSRGSLSMGAEVPVLTLVPPKTTEEKDAAAPKPAPYTYRNVGTNIDCSATTMEEGRFRLDITVEDASVHSEDDVPANTTQPIVPRSFRSGAPVFRSFRSTNSVILRDGQTQQFTTGADRVSGEVVRVDVTLNVPK